jgi:cytochrome c
MRLDLIFVLVLLLMVAPKSQAADIHEAAKNGDVAALTAALDSPASS